MIRITLAVIGGIFYALLTYMIVMLLHVTYEFAILASVVVYLFYLGSRLLLLFSGVDSPYYSRGRKEPWPTLKNSSFYDTAQWVGKFYHQHDLFLFVFMGILSIIILISLVMDGLKGNSLGDTIRVIWNALLPRP